MDGYDENLSIVCCNRAEELDEEDLDFMNWMKEKKYLTIN